MYFEDAAGKFHSVDQTGGMLVYITLSIDIFFFWLRLIPSRVFDFYLYLYMVGSTANSHLAIISLVAITSKPSLLVSE